MGREGVSAGESTSPRTGLWTRPVPWGPRGGLKEQGPERHPRPSHASRHLLQTQAAPPPVLNKLPAPTPLPPLLAGGLKLQEDSYANWVCGGGGEEGFPLCEVPSLLLIALGQMH